jgi:hypothetical protein
MFAVLPAWAVGVARTSTVITVESVASVGYLPKFYQMPII